MASNNESDQGSKPSDHTDRTIVIFLKDTLRLFHNLEIFTLLAGTLGLFSGEPVLQIAGIGLIAGTFASTMVE